MHFVCNGIDLWNRILLPYKKGTRHILYKSKCSIHYLNTMHKAHNLNDTQSRVFIYVKCMIDLVDACVCLICIHNTTTLPLIAYMSVV